MNEYRRCFAKKTSLVIARSVSALLQNCFELRESTRRIDLDKELACSQLRNRQGSLMVHVFEGWIALFENQSAQVTKFVAVCIGELLQMAVIFIELAIFDLQ